MADEPPLSVWLVDKPAGPTSHDIVATIRRTLDRGVKVGHSGTLDPFATGLLLVLVGRATRLARYLTALDKTYEADVRLGAISDTGDPEGSPRPTGSPVPLPPTVRDAVAGFLGRQRQQVPELAAVRVDGERLHRRVRRGEAVTPPERDIEIYEIELRDGPDESGLTRLLVRCSAGTYIRRIATDLGERLKCGAYCAALRRTAIGGMSIEHAVAPEEVRAHGGTPLREALGHLAARELGEGEVEAVSHGRPVSGESEGPVTLWDGDRLMGVAMGSGDGTIWPRVVLR